MKTYVLLFGLSCLFSLLLTPLVRDLAARFGWYDQPGEKKIHDRPIPRLGGVAVFFSFALSLLPLILIHNPITTQMRTHWPALERMVPAIFGVFLLGVIDDIVGVRPSVKLLVQTLCSLWLFYHGVRIGLLTNPTGKPFDLGILSLPLTVLWLVGITNAFNLVDGVDGLASGIALFGMATMATISLFTGDILPFAIVAALAGAVVGFLRFNFHPASIFLGDSGSLFLGFTLASLSLVWAQKSPLAVAVLGPIVVFALPIVDTALAIVRRFLNRVPIFGRDSDHIHHRLLSWGMSPRKVVLILYAACFVFGLLGLFFVHVSAGMAVFGLIFIFASAWLILSRMGYHELAEINLTVRRGLLKQRTIIGQRVMLRRATESVSEARDLEELWTRLVETAQAFDFDYVELSLDPQVPAKPSPALDATRMPRAVMQYWSDGAKAAVAEHPEKFWRVELPLSSDTAKHSKVIFGRALDRSELHLRLDPFIRQLSLNISKGIGKFSRHEN